MAHTIAPDVDRLPWLTDERVPKKRRSWNWLIAAFVATVVLAVAATAYWFGATRFQAIPPPSASDAQQAMTQLPAVAPVSPEEREVELPPMPQVEPAPVPAPVVIRQQQDVKPASASSRRVARQIRAAKVSLPKVEPKAEPQAKTLQFSNPWESSGASGRMVRVGTYGSLQEGKKAWSQLARAFPGMKKLPAVVTDIASLRNGKVYYRLQIGTTSQAHSEVLCQRMKAIGQSCVVVDLAGARKGSGDERQPIGI